MVRAREIITGFGDKWQQRSRFLHWSIDNWREWNKATRNMKMYKHKTTSTSYPFRAMRYWCVGCAIADEAKRLGRPVTILDAGCGKGKQKSFAGNDIEATWIAIDWLVDAGNLASLGYDEWYECNLDKPLPLPDECADITIFDHVVEHLPRPSFTMAELYRVLRPGGVLLAGSPIAPAWVALARQGQHLRAHRMGRRRPGDHITAFWPSRWRHLVMDAGLTLEFLNGAFFCRWSGSPLENCRWWARLNHLWGAFFPSLGAELYLMARKADTLPSPAPKKKAAHRVPRFSIVTRSLGWIGTAAAACVAILLSLQLWPWHEADLASLVRSHQDGNDTFYVLRHPELTDILKQGHLPVFGSMRELHSLIGAVQRKNTDPHIIVGQDQLASLGVQLPELRVVETLRRGEKHLFLVSSEGYGTPIKQMVQQAESTER